MEKVVYLVLNFEDLLNYILINEYLGV